MRSFRLQIIQYNGLDVLPRAIQRLAMSLSKSAQSIKHPGVTKPMQLNPVVLPKDLIILVDTREQQPLFTGNPQVQIGTVHHGDYTIKGFESYFAIERKKQSDLWTYCSSEMNTRTKRKMGEFNQIVRGGGFVGLVIEASEDDLLGGYAWSGKYNPNVVRGAITSFEVDYGVNVYYSRDRQAIERWILDRMVRFWENMHKI